MEWSNEVFKNQNTSNNHKSELDLPVNLSAKYIVSNLL